MWLTKMIFGSQVFIPPKTSQKPACHLNAKICPIQMAGTLLTEFTFLAKDIKTGYHKKRQKYNPNF